MATRRTARGGGSRDARPGTPRSYARPGERGTDRARATPRSTPRPRFTNRMAILVVVAAVLVVSYASSMRAYLQQRSEVADLRAQIVSSQTAIKSLQREKERWNDQAYVEAQARKRFGWVMPGESSYQVIGRDGKPLETSDELTDPRTVARQTPEAWWGKAWSSLENADHPKAKPDPATRIDGPKPSPSPSP